MRVAVEVGKTAHLYTADGKSLEFRWAQAMSIEVVGRILAPLRIKRKKVGFHRREISKANCPGARTM